MDFYKQLMTLDEIERKLDKLSVSEEDRSVLWVYCANYKILPHQVMTVYQMLKLIKEVS